MHLSSRLRITLAACTLGAAALTACNESTAPRVVATPGLVANAGVNSGGVNSGGVNGGGGSGGGSVSTPPSGACAAITSFANTTGYYKIWAAIWTKYSFTNNCGYGVNVTFTYLNKSTGNVDFASSAYLASGTIDEDWAAFSTTYTVTMTISDLLGNVITSQSADITTKVGKGGST